MLALPGHTTGRDTLASSGSHCSAASIEQTPVSKQPRLMACDARQPVSGSPLAPAQGLELSARPPRQGQVVAPEPPVILTKPRRCLVLYQVCRSFRLNALIDRAYKDVLCRRCS